MKKAIFIINNLVVLFLICVNVFAQTEKKSETRNTQTKREFKLQKSQELQALLDSAVKETVNSDVWKSKFLPGEFAVSLIDLHDANNPKIADINGEAKIYPASVVKMFYMTALHRWLEDGKVKMTPELERGLRDMIVNSSNDATQYILDVLTDTSSGGEMPAKEFEVWAYKRNAVNRYFSSLGYSNINVNQKTYCEDAYGREQQYRNYKGENRNMLNTNATARLLAEIAAGRAVSTERSRLMMDLMKRDPFAETKDFDSQASGFTGIALKKLNLTDAKLWSKAGWTSRSRHDAAYVETGDGLKFVLVIFTENHAQERDFIPAIAEKVIKGLRDLNVN